MQNGKIWQSRGSCAQPLLPIGAGLLGMETKPFGERDEGLNFAHAKHEEFFVISIMI
jgi:hypothetical protein